MSEEPTSPFTSMHPKSSPTPRTLPYEPYSLPSPQAERFVAPIIQEAPQRRPLPVRALLVTLVTVIIVGIGLGIAFVRLYTPAGDPNVTVLPSPEASEIVGLESPRKVVEEYFTALQDGNIARALELGPRGGTGSSALLSDVAYSRSREISPISNFEILTRDQDATEIEVQYLIGEEQITSSVRTMRLDNGTYRMARTTVTIKFDSIAGERVPMRVNGTEVTPTQTLELVPGRYHLTTGVPFLRYPDTNDFTIGSLATGEERLKAVTPQLTDEGRAAFLEAAKSSLSACLNSKSLAPEGCPFQIAAPAPVDASSIEWRLLNNPWAASSVTLSNDDLAVAQTTVTLQTSVNLRYADGTSSGNNPVTVTTQPSARMLGTQTDQIVITWGSS